jgi:pilus assembly protein CpaB
MDVKKVALLVGALVIAVITAVMAKNMFSGAGADSANAAPAVPTGPKIMVAKKALPVGTIIDAESVAFQAWPKDLVQNAYYAEGEPEADLQKLIGTVVRYPITAGQPLTRGAVVGPNDRGFLAAALGPGMRAVTFSVSTTAGVAGFVFPGDHVDVVLTQQVPGGGDGPPLKVSETIIRNLRILATDQRMDSKNDEGKTIVKTANTVTVEVTPKLAEKIAVAQQLGSLSLMLRSIADNQSELERMIASGNVKVPEGASPAEERKLLLAAAGRASDGATTYATGGDVSRFQRRSIPARAPATGTGSAAAPSGPTASAIPTGPTVRVSRGNNVTVVSVGAR